MQLKSIAVSLLLLASCEALRILVVFPMASKSHSILGHGVVNRLLEAGHEVVHLTAIPREEPEKNLKEIVVPDGVESLSKSYPENFNSLTLKNIVGKPNVDSTFFFDLAFDFHKLFLEDKNVVEFLGNPKEKFDAVIIEWFFSDVVAGIAPLFQCPLIWLGSTEAHWEVIKLVDNIPGPADNVDLFSTHTPPLHFWDRLSELWKMFKKIIKMNLISYPKEKELYKNYFPRIADKRGVTMPSYETAVYNGSLLLLNSHPTIRTPHSLPQSAKYVGGYHIDFKPKPLPEDIQYLMDTARYGVIYFSMGSNLKSSDMSEEMKRRILYIFSTFKQRIFWKFEGELNNIPPNVFLMKWAPQQSILAHPTLRLFITHGGQLSTTEAIHYGVPVIGVPVLADQHLNMDTVIQKGLGLKVNLNVDNFAYELGLAMTEMLITQKYKQRARELSEIYHHRPISPRKEIVHWVEHVVKTQGAPHLRSPSLMMPWYQKMYIDLITIVCSLLILSLNLINRIRYYYSIRHKVNKAEKQIQKSALNKKVR
ncbi:UDP-glucosyltransferase 2-like [Choristoneura fumiferana]|uniref:UDP-glucosyltransferase 2-like n=1 Tax=Choristoneura fumiferana TaxID=7141 RepID=UPI003D1539EB